MASNEAREARDVRQARARAVGHDEGMRTLLALMISVVTLACGSAPPAPPPDDGRPTFQVEVGASGYTPAEVVAPAGTDVRLVFTRTSDEGCGGILVFPDLDIRRDLPLNQPVWVDVTTPASGRLAFTCGMAMYEGAVVVR
jgi:plastocyanin domain-containing protein